jgi:Lrp/AsnC family leucine-responsive transcriptional regulator
MKPGGSKSKSSPDAVDQQILDELRAEPRATSKSLAQKLSLTEVTVAARIKSMEARGVMQVVAQVGFKAIGYNVIALVDVTVANGRINSVSDALCKIDAVGSVTIMSGDPPIVVHLQSTDLAALLSLILNQIATIPGVERVETNLIIDIAKWEAGSAQLHPKLLPKLRVTRA